MNTIEVEKSSGNIFADLEVEAADAMLAKAKLAQSILERIESKGLKQAESAALLGTDQSYISKLKKGSELRRFTFDRLMGWLLKLDRDVILTVKQKPQNQEAGMIQVASV
jgi:predicted XRE-type DNA-binding protein